jgi:hypothetical protein
MRFAVGATVLAAAFVRAEDASSSEAEASTSTTVAKSTFTVSTQSDSPRAYNGLANIAAALVIVDIHATLSAGLFVVPRPPFLPQEQLLTPFTTAYQRQGPILRTVHRRLGLAMEGFARKEGRQIHRGGMGLCWHLVRRGAVRAQGH